MEEIGVPGKTLVFANHPFICLIQNNYLVKLNSDILLSSNIFYNLGQISNIVNPTQTMITSSGYI